MTGAELVARLEHVATDEQRGELVDAELIRELDAIAEKAERTYHALITGSAPKGTSAMWQIRNMARDAVRWAREREAAS